MCFCRKSIILKAYNPIPLHQQILQLIQLLVNYYETYYSTWHYFTTNELLRGFR